MSDSSKKKIVSKSATQDLLENGGQLLGCVLKHVLASQKAGLLHLVTNKSENRSEINLLKNRLKV